MMHKFNRIAVMVVGVMLMLIMLLVLLTLFGATGVLPQPISQSLVNLGIAGKSAMIFVAVTIILGCLGILYYELRPIQSSHTIPLHRDELGRVVVQNTGMQRLIKYIAMEQAGVIEVEPEVTMTQQGLNVHCRVALTSDTKVDQMKNLLTVRMRQEIQRHYGVAIADIGILVDLQPLADDGQSVNMSGGRRIT